MLGDANPAVDAEVIELAWRLMHSLGLTDIQLFINSIGDKESRPRYIAELESLLFAQARKLVRGLPQPPGTQPPPPAGLQGRKMPGPRRRCSKSVDHLDSESLEHWEKLQQYLSAMDIPFQVDHRLVRGLDYYTRTVFEIQPMTAGAQSTICGGGRYDGLVEELGGRPTPGIGFGSGLERLTLNLKSSGVEVPDEPAPAYLVANVGEAARLPALELASRMRRAGAGAMLSSGSRSLRGQMRQANALGIPFAVILGDDEISRGDVVIRDMQTSTQESRPLAEFLASLGEQE